MEDFKYGERMMIYRTRAKLSKKALAEMAGTTVSVITRLENSIPNPDPDLLSDISIILDVSMNMILQGFDDPKKNQPIKGLIKNS